MTVNEAITVACALRPNELDEQILRRLVTELDHRLALESGRARMGTPAQGNSVYRDELSVPPPFSHVYWMYLVAMIDMATGDEEGFGVSYALFKEARESYLRWMHRGEGRG